MQPQPRILIADDDSHFRQALAVRLEIRGYSVVQASNGPAALMRQLTRKFDAMVLDHRMPGGTGRAITRAIRDCSSVPIIILSGCEREEFAEITHQLPDVYFLRKDSGYDGLYDLLDTICKERMPQPTSTDLFTTARPGQTVTLTPG